VLLWEAYLVVSSYMYPLGIPANVTMDKRKRKSLPVDLTHLKQEMRSFGVKANKAEPPHWN